MRLRIGDLWIKDLKDVCSAVLRVGNAAFETTKMNGRALAHRALDVNKALASTFAISGDAVRVVRVAAFQTCMIH